MPSTFPPQEPGSTGAHSSFGHDRDVPPEEFFNGTDPIWDVGASSIKISHAILDSVLARSSVPWHEFAGPDHVSERSG